MRALGLMRIRELVRKELIQVLRDPRLRRMILLAPIGQLLIFGYAVSSDVRHVALFVVDHDRTQASRELVSALTAAKYFRVVGASERSIDLVHALDRGAALAGLEIPAGYSADLEGARGAEVQLLFDGTNSNVAMIARGYAERILANHAARLRPQAIAPIDLRERAWFNPDLESRNYNLPGVVGVIMLLICLLLTSLAVVREREIGTLEQLMVSPLRPAELIAGKTIPFAMVGLLDFVIVISLGTLWFRVPFAGSLLFLFGASLLFLISGLGAGLLVSTHSRTQQEAFMTTFLLFMPTILLSGFMFPVSSMPRLCQWLTLLNPLRHYLEIARAIFLKGAGPAELWPQCLALFALGSAILAIAALRFHKQVG
jgi:ABC-2 type transport system permease protein